MTIGFVTHIEPKPAPRPRLARGNLVYMPSPYQHYKKVIGYDARKAMGNKEPLTVPLACEIDFYSTIPHSWSKKRKADALAGGIRPTNRNKGDIDNLMKGVLDACNGIVYADDSQVVNGIVRKHYAIEPYIAVRFTDTLE